MLLSALALWLICLAIGVAVLALDHMPAVPALFGGGMFMLQFEWAVVTSSLERRRLAVSSGDSGRAQRRARLPGRPRAPRPFIISNTFPVSKTSPRSDVEYFTEPENFTGNLVTDESPDVHET
jgi:hypothetical protein